jgi:hypothetical protein
MGESTRKAAEETQKHLQNAEKHLQAAEQTAGGSGDKNLQQTVKTLKETTQKTHEELGRKLDHRSG